MQGPWCGIVARHDLCMSWSRHLSADGISFRAWPLPGGTSSLAGKNAALFWQVPRRVIQVCGIKKVNPYPPSSRNSSHMLGLLVVGNIQCLGTGSAMC